MTAESIIEALNMIRHPEGGFYRETYRGENLMTLDNGRVRNTATAIYYLLKDEDKSHFHKIASDEIWFFHQGVSLEVIVITEQGRLELQTLGNRLDSGEVPQLVIKANTWFAARVKSGSGFALVSCVVAPGFDFSDFELGNKAELKRLYPELESEIEAMTL